MKLTQETHRVSLEENKQYTSDVADKQSYFEPKDEQDVFTVEDVGETIFKKALSDKKTTYLMGLNIIAEATTHEEEIRIEQTLNNLDTKVLIPIIAAIVTLINQERLKQKQN